MNIVAIAAVVLCVILGAAGGAIYIWKTARLGAVSGAGFEARITLRNTCDIGDDYFVARSATTGQIARFRSGVATLRAAEGDQIRLEIAPGFPEVAYGGYNERARPKMELVADCTSSDRQQMINRAMRESFGTH